MKSESPFSHHYTAYPFFKGPLLNFISEIDKKDVPKEWMLPVQTAKMFYVNYPLLRHDFPQFEEATMLARIPTLRNLKGKKRKKAMEEVIDHWLIKHSAFISESQANQETVNDKIETGPLKTKGFRPPNYGRAVVYSIEENLKLLGTSDVLGESPNDTGLLDVKGTGVAPGITPSFGGHHNGLMALHEALKELIFEQIIHRIFRNENSLHQTLPIYAIIDLGFDMILQRREDDPEDESKEKKIVVEQGKRPAGLLIRRAHNRPPGGGDLPHYGSHSQIAKIDIELMLRKYGMTSTSAATNIFITPFENDFKVKYSNEIIPIPEGVIRNTLLKVSRYQGEPMTFEGINIQITADLTPDPLQVTLVDFGQYAAKEDFTDPVLSLVVDRVLRWGGVIWPEDQMFERPQPRIRIPYELWGGSGSVWNFEDTLAKQRVFSFCMSLSHQYSKGILSPGDVMKYIDKYLETTVSKWNNSINK